MGNFVKHYFSIANLANFSRILGSYCIFKNIKIAKKNLTLGIQQVFFFTIFDSENLEIFSEQKNLVKFSLEKKKSQKNSELFFLVKKEKEKLSLKGKKRKRNIDKVKRPIIFIPLLSHTNSYNTMHHHCFFIPCTQKTRTYIIIDYACYICTKSNWGSSNSNNNNLVYIVCNIRVSMCNVQV